MQNELNTILINHDHESKQLETILNQLKEESVLESTSLNMKIEDLLATMQIMEIDINRQIKTIKDNDGFILTQQEEITKLNTTIID